MATKAPGTLDLITEKKHAPWGHMVASKWPLIDPSFPHVR